MAREAVRWSFCTSANIIDDFNREALAIDADFSLPAIRVVRTLERNS
ncbi:hypothetical protein GTPT_1871 [Tatumella ptyseos ATCC 33301]|uniref:Uncharacterized protein n=1 Tax=Tatumella ptyseos ATCC 33301 TaxID=1005995 RepID=A0A085JGD6_9GAMM|nr:hypothetical protein GTPT_1871 [Tatumella ptyseos ATCC 33301]